MPAFSPARRYPRHEWTGSVRFVLDGKFFLYGHGKNISEGGLAAAVPHRIEPGQQVTVEIANALGTATLVLAGVVKHRAGLVHGLEFTTASGVQRGIIRRMVSSGG